MAELHFDPDADAELSKLENDSAAADLVVKLEEVFRWLARDPGDPRLRRQRFSNGLWAVTVWARDDERSVLWDGGDLPDTVVVRWVGRLPHR